MLDVEVVGVSGQRVLRITLDREEGVTVDLCAEVSRRLSPLLDVEDPLHGAYQLEVSSPGLNRPLKRDADYIRHRGRRVKIETRRPIEPAGRQKRFSGILEDLRDGRISRALDQGERVEIPLELIHKANLIYEFDNP